jgi:ribonuclease P protein component
MECPGERVPASRHRLLKSDKLTLKTDFDAVKSNGRSAAGALLVAAVTDSENGKLQAGVICGRKFCTKAVVRNRARRLVWESFRMLKPTILTGRVVFIPRQRIKTAKCADVMREMSKLLKKLGMLQNLDSQANSQ